MPTLTEVSLFKKCVEDPLIAPLAQLNVRNINLLCDDKNEVLKKKALKLYHMFWTSVTKYLNQAVWVQQRAVELPQLGVIGLVKDRQVQGQKLTAEALD